MPQHSLGKSKPDGESKIRQLRISDEEHAAILSSLEDGENFSSFVREASKKEVKRRQEQSQESENISWVTID